MAIPLLETKLHAPQVRSEFVPRPRLIERLNAGLDRKLTLISAPAGFGKTTLLTEWVHGGDRSRACSYVAWVSLDEGDNDPARFWAYFISALQRIPGLHQAGVGESVLAALQSPRFADAGSPLAEPLLTDLINGIMATGPDRFALILDDYHVIRAQSIHGALTFLLDHLPPQMRLVVATRVDPPLPIARFRGRGQLTELRQADLRFTLDEAAEFLGRVMGLELTADDLGTLAARTEGWIAGLQMAAVSIRGQEDATAFIRAFTGSDRYIMDYLVEEVLQRQPEKVQSFLLRTSILDRLTGPLCDAVTGQGDGEATLEQLERANLFIVPLDSERRWYRYHRLFADLLRKQLDQTQPDQVAVLHRQAGAWYEASGLLAEAVDHALTGQDFYRAAQLIEQIAEATLMRSEVATFLRWVEALPEELVRARPALCVFHAWALLLSGRSLNARDSHLQHVDKGTDLMLSKMAALRALVAIIQGQIPRASELSRQALERLPEDDSFLRSVAAWSLALSYLASGDIATGTQVLEDLARVSLETGNVLLTVVALCQLAKLRMRQGQLHEARAIYQRALEVATDEEGRSLPIAGEALMGLGELLREWDDLETATSCLIEGIGLTEQWSEIGSLEGYLALARIRQAQGDADGSREAIQKAQQLAAKSDTTKLDDRIVALQQARLWVAQGDVEATARWVEGRGLEATGDSARLEDGEAFIDDHLRKYEHLVLARVFISRNEPAEALDLLEPLLPRMEQQGRVAMVIEIEMLKALALQVKGEIGKALASLERALALAEPGGYVRLFADEGLAVAQLLYEGAVRGIAPEYVGRLLAAFPASERAATFPDKPVEMVEPLSKRELEVLQLIAKGLSNREVGRQLHISLPTVKWHTSNIYGKLVVKNRTEAVAKARVLGLLPAD